MKGVIKKIVADREFGFITVEGQDDVYFNPKSLGAGVSFADLHDTDVVTFEKIEENGKTRATNLQKAA